MQTETAAATPAKHEMAIMDLTGDTKIVWDVENEAEVDHAEKTFKDFKKKRYLAYSVGKKGKKDEILHKFDPGIEAMILVPPVVGG